MKSILLRKYLKNSSPLSCWKGYSRVPGTKEFSKGSCKKNK